MHIYSAYQRRYQLMFITYICKYSFTYVYFYIYISHLTILLVYVCMQCMYIIHTLLVYEYILLVYAVTQMGLFFFIYFYQLEANYFTILQWFLPYIDMNQPWIYMCSPSRPFGGSNGKESVCSAGNLDLIPGLGRFPGEGNGNPLQYSCLVNSKDRGAWWLTVHGVVKSLT